MQELPPRVLVADDQPDILRAMRLLLKGEGFHLRTVTSPTEVICALAEEEFDVALIDLNYARDTTSGQEGLDLIPRIREFDPHLPIVVMTAWATVDLAVECMRRGACDFIQKPWENARVIATVIAQSRTHRALQRSGVLEEATRAMGRDNQPEFIARSPSMRNMLEIVDRVGPSDANVLITGENGSGKGVVARVLHARSNRSDRPFISINMGGLPTGVAESELFGHVKGAFTDAKTDRAGRFEMAANGTLFMDEIGNIPLEQQQKLLRVLETGEFERVGSSRTTKVDVRLISATNADLEAAVRDGRFRQDLLYRLNTIHLHLPPLRERLEDIPPLAQHFLSLHTRKYGKKQLRFSADALTQMGRHPWPGNVRELDHAVERAVLLAPSNTIEPPDLGLGRPVTGAQTSLPSLDDMSLEEVEKYLIQRTLTRNQGNATKTAEDLGLSRSAFYRRLQRFGL